MNRILKSGISVAGARSHNCLSAGLNAIRFAALALTFPLCVGITGCSILKPTESTARYFVLTPLPATAPGSVIANARAVGLGQVKLPAYLSNSSLAVRKGTNEVQYLESALWAERLDTAFQRVLAANLSTLLPADQVRLSSWQAANVTAEVYVSVEQFDVDASGQGILLARWRILSPGGENIMKAGTSRLSRQGPPPNAGASGAVATLSELVADFSRQLAGALK